MPAKRLRTTRRKMRPMTKTTGMRRITGMRRMRMKLAGWFGWQDGWLAG